MKSLNEDQFLAEDSDSMSILSRIIKSDGLDDRDKISGVIG